MAEKTSIAGWVTRIGGLVTVMVAALAYMQDVAKRNDDTVVQTFAFAEVFNGRDMLEIREKIDGEEWCVRYGYLEAAAPAEVAPSDTTRTPPTRGDISAYVGFFDTVFVCVQENVCSPYLAHQLFAPEAKRNYGNLAPMITGMREQESEIGLHYPFGQGLEWFATTASPERPRGWLQRWLGTRPPAQGEQAAPTQGEYVRLPCEAPE
jgi:hypothetical protein